MEKSKETRGHLQTGDVRNPTPLSERHGFMYSLVSGSLCGYCFLVLEHNKFRETDAMNAYDRKLHALPEGLDARVLAGCD